MVRLIILMCCDYHPYSENYQDDPAARFIDNRPVLLDLDSHTAYSLIKERLHDCSFHECCPQPCRAPLPTRVIDCKDPDRPRLFVNNVIEDYYVALSYVWGVGFEDLQHCTTTMNFQSYIGEIPSDIIPQTIKDAIKVTQRLGLRYLWVDSLCILQDSKEDKAAEISKILNTFRNAYVTIIAAGAQTVKDGFLHARTEMEETTTVTLPFLCPDGAIGTMEANGYYEDRMEPTEKRAWCVEERIMSPRKLIYVARTLQYECQAIHVNVNGSCTFTMPSLSLEELPRLPDPTLVTPAGPDDNDLQGEDDVTTAWRTILQAYTNGIATKPRDRLVALSGIAKHFQSFWLHGRYMAGLWDHRFPSNLLWSSVDSGRGIPRPHHYRAPSWSWASIDGAIEIYVSQMANAETLCNVIQWDVSVKRQDNPYGEVDGGYVILDGILQPAAWDPMEEKLFDAARLPTDHPDSVEWDKDELHRRRIIGRTWCDAIEPVTLVIGTVYLLAAIADDRGLHGLVLVRVIPENKDATNIQQYDHPGYPVYRRVGYFDTNVETPESANTEAWLKSCRQVIKII